MEGLLSTGPTPSSLLDVIHSSGENKGDFGGSIQIKVGIY